MKHTRVFPFTKQVAEAEGNKSPVKQSTGALHLKSLLKAQKSTFP